MQRGAMLAAIALTGCLARTLVVPDAGTAPPCETIQSPAVDSVDLLLEIDTTGAMTQNQLNLFAQLPTLVDQLVNPPLDAAGNPTHLAVRHLHVAVIDADLGTAGSTVPGCENGDVGDDGLLNPIHFGQAEQHHEPTTSAPSAFRPASCTDPTQYPAFITFESGTTDEAMFTTDVLCNAGLYIFGCGLEQQLEAVWRALIWHDASDHSGNPDPNAGFLRDNALLAIVMLTDHEDASVVDCRYVRAGIDPPCPSTHAVDVYDSASTAWSSSDLTLRDYLYQPCGAQDPTWPLDRYIDPANASNGLLGLKPGHPELVVFAAIAGVPLSGDGFPVNSDGSTNWDALLGTPGPNGPNDFCGRDASPTGMSVDLNSFEGDVSMRQANQDPNCISRTVPSCRRRGTRDDGAQPTCAATEQYFAWPARRIAEVARRFEQAALCGGAPCHGGLVASICDDDYTSAMQQIIAKIQSRLTGNCLPRVLTQTTRSDGTRAVDCVLREYVPTSSRDVPINCGAVGRMDATGTAPIVTLSDGVTYHVCDITQLRTNADAAPAAGSGWYYDTHPADTSCAQQIAFTRGAAPSPGAVTRLECGPGGTCY